MADFETIPEIAEGYARGAVSPREIVQRSLERIRKRDPHLNAFLEVAEAHALAMAAEAEAEIRRDGPRRPLHGIPFALKDIFDREGFRTTAQSRLLAENVARRSAPCVARLEAAGAIFVGKLATHEFALGGPAYDLPAPPARNPWNPAHFTGGSSSGSGAAVAARMVPFALGTDTGGSVRNPAAACGIVGMKPTYGSVPVDGVVELSRSLDTVGPMTPDVTGNEIVLRVLTGCPMDDLVAPTVPTDLKEQRIGVIRRFYRSDMQADAEMAEAIETALQALSDHGAEIVEVDVPPLQDMADCSRIILVSEAYAVHRNLLQSHAADYSASTRARILPGAFIPAADYIRARDLQHHFKARIDAALAKVDVLITATNMETPARFDEPDRLTLQYGRHARAPFNLTGHPALSMPIGFSASGLPLAMQIIGRHNDERSVYRVAQSYHRLAPHTIAAPPDLD